MYVNCSDAMKVTIGVTKAEGLEGPDPSETIRAIGATDLGLLGISKMNAK